MRNAFQEPQRLTEIITSTKKLLLKSTDSSNVQRVTKSRRKAWQPHLHFASASFTLKSPWVPGRAGLINNIFMTREQNYPQGKD
jgi:hypothetical protein